MAAADLSPNTSTIPESVLDALAGADGTGAGDRGTVGSTGVTLTVGLGGAAGAVVALGWFCTGKGNSGLPTRVSTLDGSAASSAGDGEGEGIEVAVGACNGLASACCMFA